MAGGKWGAEGLTYNIISRCNCGRCQINDKRVSRMIDTPIAEGKGEQDVRKSGENDIPVLNNASATLR